MLTNITPKGLIDGDLVDALRYIVGSLTGICTKLDVDGTIPSATYVANCITAIFNVVITDTLGNRSGQGIAESSSIAPTYIIGPGRIDDQSLNALMFQIFNSFETLTEQLDTQALTLNNYEATSYTATMLQRVEDKFGNILGNGTTNFMFKPGGMFNQKQLVEFLYNCINSINLLTTDNTSTGLDGDGTLTDTNYAALWYATILIRVENSKGNTTGTAR